MSGTTAEATKDQEPDLEVIDPPPGRVRVAGVDCKVRRIKLRELMALMNVFVMGAGHSLQLLSEMSDDPEERKQDVFALLVMSLPNAVDEFIEFVWRLLDPIREEDADRLRKALANPEIDEMLALAEVVIEQEWADLDSLMGKARNLATTMTRLRKSSAGG